MQKLNVQNLPLRPRAEATVPAPATATASAVQQHASPTAEETGEKSLRSTSDAEMEEFMRSFPSVVDIVVQVDQLVFEFQSPDMQPGLAKLLPGPNGEAGAWFRWARGELQFASEMRRAAAEGESGVKNME